MARPSWGFELAKAAGNPALQPGTPSHHSTDLQNPMRLSPCRVARSHELDAGRIAARCGYRRRFAVGLTAPPYIQCFQILKRMAWVVPTLLPIFETGLGRMWSGKNTHPHPLQDCCSSRPHPGPPFPRYGTRASLVHTDLLVGWRCFIHSLAGTILAGASSIPGLVSANWSNVPCWKSSDLTP